VIIFFLSDNFSYTFQPIRDLLDNMKFVHENWWKKSGSIFIMTEVWENRTFLLERYGHILRGSLTFKVNPEFQVNSQNK